VGRPSMSYRLSIASAWLPLYAARPPVAAALRSMARAVNRLVSLPAHALFGLPPAACTWATHVELSRNARAACASGPEVGSVRSYMVPRSTEVPRKLLTCLFQ